MSRVSPLFLGIDPGDISGGLGLIDCRGRYVDAVRTAGTKANPITSAELFEWVSGWHEDFGIGLAILEKVSAMPKQGVSSSFKFGQSLGRLQMLLAAAGIPFEWRTPADWQTKMRCRSKGNKNVTKALATDLFPDVAIFHWNADALLLGEFARRLYHERAGLSSGTVEGNIDIPVNHG